MWASVLKVVMSWSRQMFPHKHMTRQYLTRYQVKGKDSEVLRSRQKGETAVVGEGFTEEGRLKLGLKETQDLAGPQKGITGWRRSQCKGLESQESTWIKLAVKMSCKSDAFETISQTSSVKIFKSKCWPLSQRKKYWFVLTSSDKTMLQNEGDRLCHEKTRKGMGPIIKRTFIYKMGG